MADSEGASSTRTDGEIPESDANTAPPVEGETDRVPVTDGGPTRDGESGSPSESNGDDAATEEDSNNRRRALLLLVLVLLALVGGGIGTFILGTQPDAEPGVTTPSTTPIPPGPNATGNVSLAFPEGATLLSVQDIVPGDTGSSRLVLGNDGTASGSLAVSDLGVEDIEGEVLSPEAPVDDSPGEGELAERIEVRLSVQYPDGRTVRVFGTDGFVPLASLEPRNRTFGDALAPGDEAVVVLDWRLPADTGNEVQSDAVRFDVVFSLRSPNTTATE